MTCQVHKYHVPTPLRTVVHHIQPQEMGGASVPTNEVETCDTGHYNIHRLLGDLLRSGVMRRGGTKAERGLAQQGFDWWKAAGMPGKPVFQETVGT